MGLISRVSSRTYRKNMESGTTDPAKINKLKRPISKEDDENDSNLEKNKQAKLLENGSKNIDEKPELLENSSKNPDEENISQKTINSQDSQENDNNESNSSDSDDSKTEKWTNCNDPRMCLAFLQTEMHDGKDP